MDMSAVGWARRTETQSTHALHSSSSSPCLPDVSLPLTFPYYTLQFNNNSVCARLWVYVLCVFAHVISSALSSHSHIVTELPQGYGGLVLSLTWAAFLKRETTAANGSAIYLDLQLHMQFAIESTLN